MRLGRAFDTHYRDIIGWGLSAVLGFATFSKAAHDLWSATLVFALISILSLLFILGISRTQEPVVTPLGIPIALSLIVVFGFIPFSWDINTSFLEARIWLYTWIAFWLSANIFQKKSIQEIFLTAGGAVMVILAGICVYQRMSGHLETPGTLINSAILSGFALSWILLFGGEQRNHKLQLLPLAASLLILILARSWWSWVCLAFGLALSQANWRRLPLVLSLILLALYFKFHLHQAPGYRAADRWDWWLVASRMALKHPWTGIGLGAYATAFPYFKTMTVQNTLYVHSFPLQILTELGFIGLASFLFIGWKYKGLTMPKRSTGDWSTLHQSALATIGMLLCYSSITIWLDYFLCKLTLVSLLAISLPHSQLREIRFSKLPLMAITFGLFFSVPFWYLPFLSSQYYVRGIDCQSQGERRQAMDAFLTSIRLNPFDDESYAAIARLYNSEGSAHDAQTADHYLSKAFDLKKDFRYFSALQHPGSPISNAARVLAPDQ